MGNRAVITKTADLSGMGIYLHWNGGRDSIEGFLAYCKMKGYRTPEYDEYGWAMLTNVITNFFGDGMSCGTGLCRDLDCDNYDNGVYVIENWLITGRRFHRGSEQDEYMLFDFITAIDKHQPESMRLTPDEWIKFDEVKEEVEAAREKVEMFKG